MRSKRSPGEDMFETGSVASYHEDHTYLDARSIQVYTWLTFEWVNGCGVLVECN
jgi:hypothetical protein